MNNILQNIKEDMKNSNFSIIEGALRNDWDEIRGALAENPECINQRDPRMGVTALHIAAGDGNLPLVQFLCEQEGVDSAAIDAAGRRPIQLSIAIGRPDITTLLCRAVKLWPDDPDLWDDDQPPAGASIVKLSPPTP